MVTNDVGYCWSILPRVSRSFAVCIPKLPDDLKDIVCISYLICRVIDSIEDSSEEDIKVKGGQFNYFKGILNNEEVGDSSDFINSIVMKTTNKHEADLVRNLRRVIKPFSGFPLEIKDSVKKWSFEMIKGMDEFLDRKIITLDDQNEYCHYVAGTVGSMLTEMYFIKQHIKEDEFKSLINLAEGFGLGLQKTNIIKNARIDLKEGRKYWPLELLDKFNMGYEDLLKRESIRSSVKISNTLIKDAHTMLGKGLEYILFVPNNEWGIRTFSCIPLFMAVATLSKCYGNPGLFLSQADVKIDKNQSKKIIKQSLKHPYDDWEIINYFNKLRTF